jgi:hypothetical protein
MGDHLFCHGSIGPGGPQGVTTGSNAVKDVNELVLQSGHDSVGTMWRNYHKGVTEKEAEKLWSIRPSTDVENLIPFIKTVSP